jgi:signal transduction histidine kinase
VEAEETLEDVAKSDALFTAALTEAGAAGTMLSLKRLRRSWTNRDFDSFFNDVVTLVPAEPLVSPLPSTVVSGSLLFEQPPVRDTGSGDPGFTIEYAGDFLERHTDVPALAEAAFWAIEIDCDPMQRRVSIAVEPTRAALRHPKFRSSEGWRGTYPLPDEADPISFSARIFEAEVAAWPRAFGGIRVYLEGFRIPPYGDPNDDWLNLDNDYRSRGRGELGRLRRFSEWEAPAGHEDEGLVIKGNRHYFGAVFLTREGSSNLKMLVNREGFLPSRSWELVQDIVRWAIGVQVRQRRMASAEVVQHRKVDARRRRAVASRADEGSAPSVFHTKALHQEAITIAREVRSLTAAGDVRNAALRLDRLEEVVTEAQQITTEEASEAVMFRVLASVGLEQAAFVHEILGLGLTAETVASGLDRLSKGNFDRETKRRLRELAAEARDLRERLRRNGVYLADMTGVEGRKRRSRLRLRDRFQAVLDFHAAAAERRGVRIDNEIPPSLMSPPIFPAEASALFSNLLSNAVKFAGSPGWVRGSGEERGEEVVVRVENTGVGVDPAAGERWFEPFRSTTAEVDPSLGHGMGLGLTVSRSLMDEYGGEIRFVRPSPEFATAVEVRWPKR